MNNPYKPHHGHASRLFYRPKIFACTLVVFTPAVLISTLRSATRAAQQATLLPSNVVHLRAGPYRIPPFAERPRITHLADPFLVSPQVTGRGRRRFHERRKGFWRHLGYEMSTRIWAQEKDAANSLHRAYMLELFGGTCSYESLRIAPPSYALHHPRECAEFWRRVGASQSKSKSKEWEAWLTKPCCSSQGKGITVYNASRLGSLRTRWQGACADAGGGQDEGQWRQDDWLSHWMADRVRELRATRSGKGAPPGATDRAKARARLGFAREKAERQRVLSSRWRGPSGRKISQPHAHLRPGRTVVQAYIRHPLLLEGKKFDMRVYVLVARVRPWLVFFHPGVVRLAAHPYNAEASDDKRSYLTNLSLKAKGVPAEQREWSFDRLEKYLTKNKLAPDRWVSQTMLPRIKRVVRFFIEARRRKVEAAIDSGGYDSAERRLYFEGREVIGLLGLDFMVDENLRVHFIEANDTPNMSTTQHANSAWLTDEKRQLLDDAYLLCRNLHERPGNPQQQLPLPLPLPPNAPPRPRQHQSQQSMPPFVDLRCGSMWRSWELIHSDVEPGQRHEDYNPCKEFAALQ